VAINPTKQIESARSAQRKSEINSITKAIQQYSIDNNGQYPAGIDIGAKAICNTKAEQVVGGTTICTNKTDLRVLVPTYIASIPQPDSNNYYVRRSNNNIEVSHPRDSIWNIGGTPSLDLNFASNKSLIDSISGNNLIDFARNSPATYVGADGLIKTAATDEARFDHNPTTGESLGLLVEEQRTNSIRNNTMVGAVAGTPGTLPTNWIGALSGVARTVVGTGTIDGISYVDIRVNGTTTSAGGIQIKPDGNAGVISATASQAWAMSLWVSVVAGSTTNTTGQRLIVNEYSAGPTYLRTAVAATNILSGGSTLRRVSGAITTGASTTILEPILLLDVNSGVAIDITLRIGMPQLEQGAFATSVIPTTTAAATRNADLAEIAGTNFSSWYRQDEGTLFSSAASGTLGAASNYWDFSDGTTNNRMVPYTNNPTTAAIFYATGGVGFVMAPGSIVAGSRNSVAFAYKANDLAAALNGGSPVFNTSSAVAVGINKVNIGANLFTTAPINGTIRRLTYWPSRLSNTTLQSITQ
jgi:hypothetical protein